ncbi:MAG: hypothetical protein IKU60_05705 [Clostridia bacterium]|nr:hypothetical protein [Clostridia bacterium]
MSVNRKKPVSITLAAASVICIITFILGFVISSFAFLDSRLETANEKNAELTQTINEKDAQIKELKGVIEQKDENNIILADKIQTHLDTIEKLKSEVSHLQSDVDTISEAAINSDFGASTALLVSFSTLTPSQQLIILVLLLVILIFIISITCGIIASKSSGKSKKSVENKIEEALEPSSSEETEEEDSEPASEPVEEEAIEEPTMVSFDRAIPAVEKAIDLLYHNNLEDSISALGGFRFGITNFDEILSDKRRPKSFGNSENGDFVAFMSSSQGAKKLYIIPRFLVLSDSTVALRGVTDLFDTVNEAGNVVTHGSVKIKTISSPAVFSCGDSGWAIESKGKLISLGTTSY